jgi:MFS family permease
MIGSICCALSTSITDFVIARIIQGLGGAMMIPVGRLVILRSIDKSALVNAMAWVTMPALIGPVIGPPLGGFITTYFSWHWIFLINIPIGLLGIWLALKYQSDQEREPGTV